MNGGTRPSRAAIATSQGSSIRRRASLKTQNAVASQKTTTKNPVRFRARVKVLESKKLSAMIMVAASEKELAEDIPGGERNSYDRDEDDEREGEDGDAFAHAGAPFHRLSAASRSARR